MPNPIVRPRPQPGQLFALKKQYRHWGLSKFLKIKSACTPTSMWCESWGLQFSANGWQWGTAPLDGTGLIGSSMFRKYYDQVTEPEAIEIAQVLLNRGHAAHRRELPELHASATTTTTAHA